MSAPVCADPPPSCCRESTPAFVRLPPESERPVETVVVASCPVPFPVTSVPAWMFPHPVPPPRTERMPEREGVKVKVLPAPVTETALVRPFVVEVVVPKVRAPEAVKLGTEKERTPVLVTVKFVPPTRDPGVPENETPVPAIMDEVATAVGTALPPVAFARTEFALIGAKPMVAFVPETWYPKEPEDTWRPVPTEREEVATDDRGAVPLP